MRVSSGQIVIKKVLRESWSSRKEHLEWWWMPTLKHHQFPCLIGWIYSCIFMKRLKYLNVSLLISDVHVYVHNLLKLNSNIHSRQTKYCNFNPTSPRYNRETEGGRTFTITTCKSMEQFTFAFKTKRLSGFFPKNIVEWVFHTTADSWLFFFLSCSSSCDQIIMLNFIFF